MGARQYHALDLDYVLEFCGGLVVQLTGEYNGKGLAHLAQVSNFLADIQVGEKKVYNILKFH